MTDKTDSKERDLMELVDAYAEARHIGGCHTYNAKTAEARAKVIASLAASAGSEPVAHLWQHSETGRTRVLMPDMIVDADASWRLVGPLFLGSPPSPPEGMVMVPKEPTKAMLLAGSADLLLGDCIGTLTRASECYRAMLEAAPPTTSAGSGKGE